LPSLENLHQHFKDKNFTLLAVDVGEKKETVQRFVHDQGLSFRFLLDEDGQVSAEYGIRSHPMKFLIDKKGNIVGIAQGFREWDKEEMKSLVQLLINLA
jgi:peroxiredoxin